MNPASLARAGILASFALVAGVAVHAIVGKERTIETGRVVLAELAPVDPRSLMQGDYMALRFAIDNALPHPGRGTSTPAPRYAHLALDAAGRATLAAVAQDLPASSELVAVRIRLRDGRPSIGPNAFFFQEGAADTFVSARWGEFRVGADGTALLTHLRDAGLNRLGAQHR